MPLSRSLIDLSTAYSFILFPSIPSFIPLPDRSFPIALVSASMHLFIHLEPQIPPNLRPQLRQLIRHALHILVTAPTETDHDILALLHRLGQLQRAVDSVRRL